MEQQQLQKLNATVDRLVNGNTLKYFNVVPEPKLEPKSTSSVCFFLRTDSHNYTLTENRHNRKNPKV